MNKKSFITFSFIFILTINGEVFCTPPSDTSINIIPKPFFVELHKGSFTLNEKTVIIISGNDSLLNKQAEFLNEALRNSIGYNLEIETFEKNSGNNFIQFQIINEPETGNEGYSLEVKYNSILIKAGESRGIFYGIQSLLQLFPPEIFKKAFVKNQKWDIPCLIIQDKPQYPYRGMHLDVSRHFFGKDFIKKYLDLLAMYKLNYFHWHLTDDNGWRIEIKKYPLLTKISSWRVNREKWDKWLPVQRGEKASYGGYYTQEDIKEIVKYASDRFITIIPEIEMPAHTSEVFAAYPQYSCRGETLNVCPGSYWPNKDIFCAGNDSTFTFIENILSEISSLFPGPYIHIGGDEADKTLWEKCPKCQARIRNEGLRNTDDLQSYFIKRINRYLISIHKKMIGWDEIMKGGLAPGATVMCWNSIDKGFEAAKQDHNVIMTPTKYCYFDYYQSNPEFDTLGTGGLITLKDIYSFNPTPAGLTEKESAHILGAQANLWTEHVNTPERAEYMILPRMLALSEDVWSQPGNKKWNDFLSRVYEHYKIFDAMGLNYSRGSYAVKINPVYNSDAKNFTVSLSSEQLNPRIYFTLNGTSPDINSKIYSSPFIIDKMTIIKAAILRDNNPVQGISEKTIYPGYELGRKILYTNQPIKKYIGDNENNTLIDGVRGSTYYYDGNWQGFLEKNFDVFIDLGEASPVHQISVDFLNNLSDWIFLPESVNISVSPDGIEYKDFITKTDSSELKSDSVFVKTFNQNVKDENIRFIHIIGKNIGTCPPRHIGAGEPAWIFCDEVLIE
ncbi:MAG TPA: family 20 glycosylhydrolase [Ignavibacteriaceae bacterium]|nr:family 20 glycosylhydrolase [Ignavibacteriaceae bacterium]